MFQKKNVYLHIIINNSVTQKYGYKGDIQVVKNGTDFTYPENTDQLIDRVNEIHNLKDEENVFLFVGRMAKYKNLEFLLNSLKILKDAGESFKMIFIGGGFDLDEIKLYAEKLNLKSECIFVGQLGDRDLLQGYYLRATSLVFPSVFDTAGIVTIEAAAHKKPTVLIEGSCSAEQVADGVNGFTVKENEQLFAQKLQYICNNSKEVKEVGEKAYPRSGYRCGNLRRGGRYVCRSYCGAGNP